MQLVDAKSIMSVMMLAAGKGTVLDLKIDGKDEKDGPGGTYDTDCKPLRRSRVAAPVTNHVVAAGRFPDNLSAGGYMLPAAQSGAHGMPQNIAKSQDTLDRLTLALDSGAFVDVQRMLNGMPPADIAHLLESSPPKFRNILWKLIDVDIEGEVLGELPDDLQAHFLSRMDAAEVATITEGLEDDDIADILQQLPDRITWEVLNSMDHQDRARLEQVMLYPDDVAGGLMNTDTITIRARLTLDVVLRYLRRHEDLPPMTDNLIVVNRSDQFIGLLPLRTLLVSDPATTVREMMVTDVNPIPVDMPDDEVARLFERNDWVSAPVVDEGGGCWGVLRSTTW